MSAAARPAGRQLSERQRIAWLRLIRTDNVGPATFRDLINNYGSAETALEMLPELVRRGGGLRSIRIPSQAEAADELERAKRMGASFVAIGEPDYPPMLRRMDQPPPLLAIAGQPSVLQAPAIAMVGARNASLVGIKMASALARDFGRAGYSVVSGLARGIDAAAHRGSLETGTIAALAGGLDKPYPPENVALSEEIRENGAIVSEMPFGWEPRARDFPRRNRIISGLSVGVVLIEAARRSGSLITARLAGEQGREVFAVPGSPLDPRAAGTNALLKDGAVLVTEAADVLDHIAPLAGNAPRLPDALEEPADFGAALPPSDDDRDRVLEALGPAPVAIDEIIRHTGVHPAQLSLILLELDLAGRLARHPGGNVSLLYGD